MALTTKPSIFEALSDWAKPADAIMILQEIATRVDEVASRSGCTELDGFQMLKPLGMTRIHELLGLQARGLKLTHVGASVRIDSRAFRSWITIECQRLSRKPWKEPVAQPVQTKVWLF